MNLFRLLILLLFPIFANAEEIELYDTSAPAADRLFDKTTGEFWAPVGDWANYFQKLNSEWPSDNPGPLAAFLDSGVLADHPIIKPVLVEAIDLTGEGSEDRVGHGTFVILQFLGASGPTPILSIKIFGGATEVSATDRMTSALKLAASRGAKIANVSAGISVPCANARDPDPPRWLEPCEEARICKVVNELSKQGLLVIAAVGNDPEKTGCPACCKDALAVGAADSDGKPASYSGRFADILAPGAVEFGPVGKVRN